MMAGWLNEGASMTHDEQSLQIFTGNRFYDSVGAVLGAPADIWQGSELYLLRQRCYRNRDGGSAEEKRQRHLPKDPAR